MVHACAQITPPPTDEVAGLVGAPNVPKYVVVGGSPNKSASHPLSLEAQEHAITLEVHRQSDASSLLRLDRPCRRHSSEETANLPCANSEGSVDEDVEADSVAWIGAVVLVARIALSRPH